MGTVSSLQAESPPPQRSPALLLRKNLIFPNEILEKIISFLSFRDRLICREVCTDWLQYINVGGGLQDLVRIKVTSDELNYLADSDPIFTRFYFHKLDLTRQSSSFWNIYSDTITHLDFYDCAVIPRNTAESQQVEFTLGCPNLKHLGLVNCDKYFLMGGRFIQLSEILCLENLESLDLSRNKNLSDNILFSILLKTKKLRSINLSDCVNMVYMNAVHNRFYRTGSQDSEIDDSKIATFFSDHILSFHTFCTHFLRTERAHQMKDFDFGMKLNTTGMNLILACDNIKWERVNLESPELKPSDLKTFLERNRHSLIAIKLGRCKLSSEEIMGANMSNLEELELHDSRSITSLNFLVAMPNLRKLLLDGLHGFNLQNENFANFSNLSDLSLNGFKPNGNPESCRRELIQSLKHLRNLTALDVGNAPHIVNDEVVQAIIYNLRELKRLNLESSSITDFALAGCQNQGDCTHEGRNFGFSLSKLCDLEYLNLSHCRDLGDCTWQKAFKLPSLISLNLSNCPTLSKRGILSIIHNCRNLEKLILIHCSRQILTDADVLTAAREILYRCREITY